MEELTKVVDNIYLLNNYQSQELKITLSALSVHGF